MDNASKALIVAGAVLTSILVVATGVQVYNSTGKGASEQAKQASEKMWAGADLSMGLGGANIDVELISKQTSYIGCYANLDNDPEPEGIIYADLAESKSGEWGTTGDPTFSYKAITIGLKDYYISDTDVIGAFGTEPRDVITVAPSSKGKDRFYVMALEDFNKGTYYCWYDGACKEELVNSTPSYTVNIEKGTAPGEFGTGAKNTKTMIEKWNKKAYGKQNNNEIYKDVWGEIQDEVNKGWFVPSRGELCAFVYNLGITENNLSDAYWSSSYKDHNINGYNYDGGVWVAHLEYNYWWGCQYSMLYYVHAVRLSTTF